MATASCRARSDAPPRTGTEGPPGYGPNSGREHALFRALAAGPVFHNPFSIPLK